MNEKTFGFMILITFLILIGILGGIFITKYQNSFKSYADAYIEKQIEQKYKDIEKDKKLYKAIYYASNKQKTFYFQTAKNPFEVAENYLPSEWHGLAIERWSLE